jgi:SAM-dependent methyltransferase
MILAEFTGERVIPGLVEPSLWNEHVSRYSFAATLAAGKRVLDVGCGTGYGAASLAVTAAHTVGFDISPEAVEYAAQNYGDKVEFIVGSAENFPASLGAFGLITAFEVIEHLADWPRLLSEANRVLADDGLFLVSTPNKTYYAEARKREGPNPFHVHEFEYEEFRESLKAWFPHVRILAQNRVEAFSFFGEESPPIGTATFAEAADHVADAHFYIAICGRQLVPALSYVYVPREGNMLREREQYIHSLQEELKTLGQERQQHIQLLQQELKTMVEERKVAAAQLAQFESDLAERGAWIAGLEQEVLNHQRERDASLAALKVAENDLEQRTNWANHIQGELKERTEWAQSLDQDVARTRGQVYELLAKLSETEAVVVERTKWAQELEARVNELTRARTRLSEIEATLADKELVIAELTSEVTRGRKELGLLLAAMRAQSALADENNRALGPGHPPAASHEEFAELGELVTELDKLRVSQARLFEIQIQTRSELQRRLETLMEERGLAANSRWIKLGRKLGLGPRLD